MKKSEKIIISKLTTDGVKIEREEYVEIEKEEVIKTGKVKSTTYFNSPSQRKRLTEEQPQNVVNAVLSMWGEECTFEDLFTDSKN